MGGKGALDGGASWAAGWFTSRPSNTAKATGGRDPGGKSANSIKVSISLTLEIRYISDVDNELVAVGREYRDREPHRNAVAVVGNPESLVHGDPAVRGHLEEVRLDGVRHPHGNPVAVTHLLDAELLAQVLDGPFLDVLRAPQP